MKLTKSLVTLVALASIAFSACKTKQTSTAATIVCKSLVTYETLKPLLEKSCTTSGCHDESKRKLNFKIYANIKAIGAEGEVKEHVLDRKDMPPFPAPNLSPEELNLFKCWIEGGMLEK